jgi:hypothetical protein
MYRKDILLASSGTLKLKSICPSPPTPRMLIPTSLCQDHRDYSSNLYVCSEHNYAVFAERMAQTGRKISPAK